MTTIELAEYGPDFIAAPYPYYAKLRETGPVHEVRGPAGNRFWLVVGFEEGRGALTDPRLTKSPAAVGLAHEMDAIVGPHVLALDPPDHTRLRKLVAPEFTARRVDNLRPRIQRITDELLDTMLPAGQGDLVDALAFPLPIIVICELLGVPHADRDVFRAWSNEIVAPTSPTSTGRASSRSARTSTSSSRPSAPASPPTTCSPLCCVPARRTATGCPRTNCAAGPTSC